MHIVTSTDILLPRAEDMGAWSVIACDQFTSEPEYWAAAEACAAEKPSTLSLMLPEAWLHTARADGADGRIADTMRRYLAEGVFQTVPDSFIYVERTLSDGRVRRGLVAALDLEQYDFTGTQRTSVRSTEGTVEERLPPRVNIRRSAPLEMPHTLLLMDDRTDSVLSLAEKAKDTLEKVYDFDLMLGGGHIAGWRVSGETKAAVQSALDALDNAALQREKYGDAAENGSSPLPSATATTRSPRPSGSGRKSAKLCRKTSGRPIPPASRSWRSRTSMSRRSILSRSTA